MCCLEVALLFPMGEEGVGKRGGVLGKSGVRRMPPQTEKRWKGKNEQTTIIIIIRGEELLHKQKIMDTSKNHKVVVHTTHHGMC